jgi:cell division protein FtsB
MVAIVFLIITFTIGDSNIFIRAKYDEQIRSLEREILQYRDEAEASRRKLTELRNNDNDLERFAREEYLMKKPDEDLFIIK